MNCPENKTVYGYTKAYSLAFIQFNPARSSRIDLKRIQANLPESFLFKINTAKFETIIVVAALALAIEYAYPDTAKVRQSAHMGIRKY